MYIFGYHEEMKCNIFSRSKMVMKNAAMFKLLIPGSACLSGRREV